MTTALVIGEAVLDVVQATGTDPVQRPGGSAVNVAVALARLGRPVRLATSYAADGAGELLDGHLRAAGVDLAADPHVLASTPRADAVIDATGAASYTFEVGWQLPPDVPTGQGTDAPHVVHVTSLAPLLDPGAADVFALVEQLRTTTTVSYDVNLRPAITGTGPEVLAGVTRMAALAHLVKASDEDLLALWPDQDPGESAALLLELGAAAVVVTHGDGGASWHSRCGCDWCTGGIHAQTVEVVDTIGAGDTFGAALIDHLWSLLGVGGADRIAALEAEEWIAALEYAAKAAAITVGRVGADPPTRAELG
ncbi:PfkB family carbohydrate kinase [Nocardioides sp. WS12]|uniref:PfkB family carbohydrate kinase n=1 Tax=Nocardioides sp. WS12 TaxID=2486272 RepID=UPI0015FA512A|nr:PfkB family carbohydrate kinase [Nocardioides sp. WS12]